MSVTQDVCVSENTNLGGKNMNITSKLKIDLQNNSGSVWIQTMQEDTNTRSVEVSLYDGTQPWEIPAGTTAAVGFKKPDGTAGLYDKMPDGMDAVTLSENAVTVTLVPQMLTVPGLVRAVVTLYDAQRNQLSTFPFMIQVEENPAAGTVVSENYCYYTSVAEINEALNAALNTMEETVSTVENKLESGEFNGKSAYAYALEGGFEGSEESFADILAGARAGFDGGYYVPEVSQPDVNHMSIVFSASQEGMAAVSGKTIILPTGAAGYSPVRGKDYWTTEDVMEIKSYVDEAILGGAW